MNRWCKLSIILLHTSLTVAAQNTNIANDYASTLYADATQTWHNTLNPAGLTRDSLQKRGTAYFDFQHMEGTHYLVQNGDEENKFTFYADAYQPIGKLLYGYGKMAFEEGREFNRSWSDVLRSHHSNPYFSGSSISAKYDLHNVDLTASLATIDVNNFTFGARLDYKVGDFSRLRDPRSRINLAEYRITPAATYRTGKHIMGLSAHYKRRKEKLVGLKTVQTDAIMKYYTYTGLENAVGSAGGYKSYEREYVDHELGGELSYNYRGRNFQSLNTLTLNTAHEDIYGTNKYMPGKYLRKEYSFASHNLVKTSDKLLHSIDATVSIRPAQGDEYRQQKVITLDSVTGISSQEWKTTMTLNKRYEVQEYEADLRYRLMWTNNQAITSFAGLHIHYVYDKDEYHLPESFLETGGADIMLEGGSRIFRRNEKSLWIEGMLGYHAATQSKLSLSNSSTDYAVNVLLPDMKYWKANYIMGNLEVSYHFPISIKNVRHEWFVKARGHYLSTDQSTNAWNAGVSFGVFY